MENIIHIENISYKDFPQIKNVIRIKPFTV